ncbi:MAG: AraC family transcriptional regulator [Eubacteriales bacterium]|nr:AraC family transcriptional regulator [Eubacteriales bacterium]
MQIQSGVSIYYHNVTLSPDFPILNIGSQPLCEVTNSPITFLHYNEFFEIGYCYEGCGLFFVGNKVLEYSAGDAVVIFPQQIHIAQSSSASNSKWDFVNFNPAKLLSFVSMPDLKPVLSFRHPSENFPNIMTIKQNPEIVWMIRHIIHELRSQDKYYQPSVRSLIWYLCLCINRMNTSEQALTDNNTCMDMEFITPAINYMILHYAEDITIPQLAHLCSMSLSSLRRAFHNYIGMSPLEYLIQLRIKMAAVELKSSNRSITDIAQSVGFYSISSFNRHFLSHFGVSPREWIKRE